MRRCWCDYTLYMSNTCINWALLWPLSCGELSVFFGDKFSSGHDSACHVLYRWRFHSICAYLIEKVLAVLSAVSLSINPCNFAYMKIKAHNYVLMPLVGIANNINGAWSLPIHVHFKHTTATLQSLHPGTPQCNTS